MYIIHVKYSVLENLCPSHVTYMIIKNTWSVGFQFQSFSFFVNDDDQFNDYECLIMVIFFQGEKVPKSTTKN